MIFLEKIKQYPLLFLLLLALIFRLAFFNFPSLTAEESLYGARGSYLSKYGTDELDRKLPIFFNSNHDYKLPLTSYISSVGMFLFGANDFGLRIPFIFIGVLVVYLIYLISNKLDPKISHLATLVAALSPTLIFLSKTPNQLIVSLSNFLTHHCY